MTDAATLVAPPTPETKKKVRAPISEEKRAKARKYSQYYYKKEREARLEYARKYALAKPDAWYKPHVRRLFGITPDMYAQMLEAQGGVCAICKSESTGTYRAKRFCVDHDHKTRKVRGLLCSKCNMLLGFARDNVQFLATAIEYLAKQTKDDPNA